MGTHQADYKESAFAPVGQAPITLSQIGPDTDCPSHFTLRGKVSFLMKARKAKRNLSKESNASKVDLFFGNGHSLN